jgi:hypothetical protein
MGMSLWRCDKSKFYAMSHATYFVATHHGSKMGKRFSDSSPRTLFFRSLSRKLIYKSEILPDTRRARYLKLKISGALKLKKKTISLGTIIRSPEIGQMYLKY